MRTSPMAMPRRPSNCGMRAGRFARTLSVADRAELPREDLSSAATGSGLNAIGNGALHALEEDEAAEEGDEDCGAGNEEAGGGSVSVAGKRPAKTVNDAVHGIEAVEPAPTLRNERTGIGDGRSEHPELKKERDDVFDVAIEGIEGGEPEADAKSGENGEKQKERKQSGGGGRGQGAKKRQPEEGTKAAEGN